MTRRNIRSFALTQQCPNFFEYVNAHRIAHRLGCTVLKAIENKKN